MADYACGVRQGLPVISIMDETGNMTCEPVKDVPRFVAREMVLQQLKARLYAYPRPLLSDAANRTGYGGIGERGVPCHGILPIAL